MQYGFTVMSISSSNNCSKQGNSEEQTTFLLPQLPSGAFLPLLRVVLPQKFPLHLCVVKCPLTGPGTSSSTVQVKATLTMERSSCCLTKEGMTAGVISCPLTGLEHSLLNCTLSGTDSIVSGFFKNSSNYQPRLCSGSKFIDY